MRLRHLRTKLGKLAIMYLCVRGTDLNHSASVYDIYIELWSCPNVWYFFIFFSFYYSIYLLPLLHFNQLEIKKILQVLIIPPIISTSI
jgi:hypothetical protein